ncbi:hypothetical protein PIB30_029755 [Stylosanthes scabra]|uniref:Ubiquitin-like protease family profile domain-containing protein n=1 Tax=Stylosanthes scabra TaxID=79078 RepID=A0ABU6QBI5_9FABA|nr:hypothetical protein [Stylosanthes scabra]
MTWARRDSGPIPHQHRASTMPRRGLSPLTTPRCGREAQSTPESSCNVLQAPQAAHDRAKATLGREPSMITTSRPRLDHARAWIQHDLSSAQPKAQLCNVAGSLNIFVPIHGGNKHWFLMIVDMNNDRIFLIDSAKSTSSNYHRRFSVETMVTESTRMRLAIDLVRGDSNLKRAEVTSKAHGYMKELLEKQSKLRTV